jgi:hypothetical protein
MNWPLNTDNRRAPDRLHNNGAQLVYATLVGAANWTHLHNLAFDKLNAVSLGKDTGLKHPVIIINIEVTLLRLN